MARAWTAALLVVQTVTIGGCVFVEERTKLLDDTDKEITGSLHKSGEGGSADAVNTVHDTKIDTFANPLGTKLTHSQGRVLSSGQARWPSGKNRLALSQRKVRTKPFVHTKPFAHATSVGANIHRTVPMPDDIAPTRKIVRKRFVPMQASQNVRRMRRRIARQPEDVALQEVPSLDTAEKKHFDQGEGGVSALTTEGLRPNAFANGVGSASLSDASAAPTVDATSAASPLKLLVTTDAVAIPVTATTLANTTVGAQVTPTSLRSDPAVVSEVIGMVATSSAGHLVGLQMVPLATAPGVAAAAPLPGAIAAPATTAVTAPVSAGATGAASAPRTVAVAGEGTGTIEMPAEGAVAAPAVGAVAAPAAGPVAPPEPVAAPATGAIVALATDRAVPAAAAVAAPAEGAVAAPAKEAVAVPAAAAVAAPAEGAVAAPAKEAVAVPAAAAVAAPAEGAVAAPAKEAVAVPAAGAVAAPAEGAVATLGAAVGAAPSAGTTAAPVAAAVTAPVARDVAATVTGAVVKAEAVATPTAPTAGVGAAPVDPAAKNVTSSTASSISTDSVADLMATFRARQKGLRESIASLTHADTWMSKVSGVLEASAVLDAVEVATADSDELEEELKSNTKRLLKLVDSSLGSIEKVGAKVEKVQTQAKAAKILSEAATNETKAPAARAEAVRLVAHAVGQAKDATANEPERAAPLEKATPATEPATASPSLAASPAAIVATTVPALATLAVPATRAIPSLQVPVSAQATATPAVPAVAPASESQAVPALVPATAAPAVPALAGIGVSTVTDEVSALVGNIDVPRKRGVRHTKGKAKALPVQARPASFREEALDDASSKDDDVTFAYSQDAEAEGSEEDESSVVLVDQAYADAESGEMTDEDFIEDDVLNDAEAEQMLVLNEAVEEEGADDQMVEALDDDVVSTHLSEGAEFE